MQDTMPSQQPVTIIGKRYVLLQHLATGGAGVVYEAEHLHSGARVALKLGKRCDGPSAAGGMQTETRIVRALHSEHVVRIVDADPCGEQPFIAMELLRGKTLEDEARRPLRPARVLALMGQLAEGLEQVHAAGYAHCDLKPENIFLSERADGTEVLKLLDFGIAQQLGGHSGAVRTLFCGTPAYMSPEQAHGRRDLIDQRTDTWAFGMIAFRLLFGRSYFPEDVLQRMLLRLLFGELRAPSRVGCRVSAAFDAWFLRSCSRCPSQRFVSVREQLDALRDALRGVRRVRISAAHYERGAQRALDCEAWPGDARSSASCCSSCGSSAAGHAESGMCTTPYAVRANGLRRPLWPEGKGLLRALCVAALPLLALVRLFAARFATP